MEILLLSLGLGALAEFLPPPARIGFVPTAGETYDDPYFVVADRDRLVRLGYQVEDIDISNAPYDELIAKMEGADAIFVAGGNSFYLLQQIRDRGLFEPLRNLILAGKPYIGASAGAAICAPTLDPVVPLDDPADAKTLKTHDGLAVVDFVILPHFGKPKYLDLYNGIVAEFGPRMTVVTLRDDQAIRATSATDFQVIESAMVLHDE